MRSKEELMAIAEQWAEEMLKGWQPFSPAWEMEMDNYDLTDQELNYLRREIQFTVAVSV